MSASPERTIAALADLGTYPAWLSIVSAAEPIADETATWDVTLRARLGPLARSKRLRMTRTMLDDEQVRFERNEVDGRDHAEWVLTARVDPADRGGSDVTVDLHYGGSLWSTPLEMALASVEGSAADGLDAHLADPG